jgi:hypothetical protein
MTQNSRDRDIIINGFIKHHLMEILHTQTKFTTKFDGIWMACIEPPKGPVDIQRQLTPFS